MIKLSIIVPVYNCETFLAQCLDSILACPIEDMECIVINDGSSDTSLDICMKYHNMDSRFTILDQKNQGVSKTRNRGIMLSKGKYIMFLDADDYFDTTMWKEISKDLDHNCYDFIGYSHYTLYKSGETKHELLCDLDSMIQDHDYITKLLYTSSSLNTCWGKIFLADYIKSNHVEFCPDLKVGEDYVFVADYLGYCSSPVLKGKCILYYRQHEKSAMRTYDMSTRLQYLLTLYTFNQTKVNEHKELNLQSDMDYYYFCMLTDLFLDFAVHKSRKELRFSYQKAIGNELVPTILNRVHRENIKKVYKRVEYFLFHNNLQCMLVLYFKLKAKVAQRC